MGRKSGGGQHAHHKHSSDDGDHYVQRGTNWESYELPQLIAMVNEKVDIPALVRLADDWRYAGDDLMASAKDLAGSLDQLMDFWSGDAAEQARTDVALNAQWVSDLGETANEIGTPVEEAAGALKAAQDQMPDLPAITPAVGSAPDGAANAGGAGGPLGAAIGGVSAGSESAAQASEQEAKLKLQAVETMRRFESAAIGIDESIPAFAGPDTVIHQDPIETKPGKWVPTPPPTLIVDTNTTVSWQQLTGSGTAAQEFGGHGGGSSHAGFPMSAGGGAGVGAGPHPGPAPGTGSVSGAAPLVERVGVGALPPAAGMPVEMEGHAGMAGGAGAPMGAGMGAGAGGGTGNDHRRRFPFEEDDPFSPDQKASPPVIGL